MRHFLADDDLSPDELVEVLDLADELRTDRFAHRPLAGPQTVAVLFDKPSTRTRVSFATGIADLGGSPLVVDTATSQLGRGEPVADTARVLSAMCAAVVWRTAAQSGLEELAAYATVPVVNALSDDFHPCQVLADLQTVRARFGQLAGLRFTYVGDGANNMAASYLLGGANAGLHVTVGSPAAYAPDTALLDRAATVAKQTGGSVRWIEDPAEAVAGADVVATDCWVSMGDEEAADERQRPFVPYAITESLLDGADRDAAVLHCLPAYRGKEISAEVIDGPRSLVWQQVENRLHAQKALLCFLLDAANGTGTAR